MQVKSESNKNAIKFETKAKCKVNCILKENAKQNISRSQSQLKLSTFWKENEKQSQWQRSAMRRSTFVWSKIESELFPWPSAATAKPTPGLQINNSAYKPVRPFYVCLFLYRGQRDSSACRSGAWRRYTAIQRAKRKGKKTGEESTVVEEIVVQRMNADVSGKQQEIH